MSTDMAPKTPKLEQPHETGAQLRTLKADLRQMAINIVQIAAMGLHPTKKLTALADRIRSEIACRCEEVDPMLADYLITHFDDCVTAEASRVLAQGSSVGRA